MSMEVAEVTAAEATGTYILILGKAFRGFEGATMGCLAAFLDGSEDEVRVCFCTCVLGGAALLRPPVGS